MATDMEFMNRIFHAALRRDLARVINVLADAKDHAPEQRAALAEQVGLVLDLLHHHHTGEDTGLWPLVRRRAPDLGTQLDTMEAEHASVAGAIVSTRATARQYATTTDPLGVGRRMRLALSELSDALLPHLEHEETEVMPRVMRALTNRDWSALSRGELRNWNSLALAGTGLVWMADGLNQTQRTLFNQQVSPIFRWLVDQRYGPAYRRRTALAFGAASGGPSLPQKR
jgi:hemerythrin-like domain-containing protein